MRFDILFSFSLPSLWCDTNGMGPRSFSTSGRSMARAMRWPGLHGLYDSSVINS